MLATALKAQGILQGIVLGDLGLQHHLDPLPAGPVSAGPATARDAAATREQEEDDDEDVAAMMARYSLEIVGPREEIKVH